MEPNELHTEVIDSFFEHYYRRRPVNATFTGIHEYDSMLPDWSLDGLQELTREMVSLRERLSPYVSDQTDFGRIPMPDEAAAIDCALADAFLEIQIAELEGVHFQRGNPAHYTGEAVFAVVSLMLRDFAPASERLAAIEHRISAIPGFLTDAKQTIGDRPIPASWTTRALDECVGTLYVFGNGLQRWCHQHQLDTDGNAALAAAALRAQAATEDFRLWLNSRTEAPARASGAGPDFLGLVLSQGHWDSRSRSDLLAEVKTRFEEAEIRLQEMAAVADPGGWEAVSARLADLHPETTGYLDAFGTCWTACRDLAIGRDLVTWPDFPIRYTQTPTWVREAAPHLYFLNYRSPAPFGQIKIHEYLAPPIDEAAGSEVQKEFLRGVNDGVIKLNHVVHHGALGHHVQNFYAMRSESRIGRVAAVDCASRIGMFCGGSLAEGWACYATDLMGEIGFLTNLELVAEQHSRLRQLARAIVDIELHQHSWTDVDARRFYEERVGMSAGAAAKEVTRNSMFPGASIMYWLGTQGIHDLRNKMQSIAGSEFSLRAFHDKFLSYGSIPVLLIARLMAGSTPT
jgi:hypothetical protein